MKSESRNSMLNEVSASEANDVQGGAAFLVGSIATSGRTDLGAFEVGGGGVRAGTPGTTLCHITKERLFGCDVKSN